MLTAHVTASVGWLGSVAAFLALAVVGVTSQDARTVQAAYPAMDVVARFVIVPLAVASLLTGLVQALGTAWGLFRHYWVLIKFVITVVAAAVLLQKLGLISDLADAATQRTLSSADLRQDRLSLVVHAGGGLLALLVPTVLSIFKPRGLTRYGRRKQPQPPVEGQQKRGRPPVPEASTGA
jgi:hypothetical protein